MYHSIRTLLNCTLLLVLLSCSQNQEQENIKIPEEAGTYIDAYTSGIISRHSDIQVHFTQTVIPPDQIQQEEKRKLLSLSDGISGKLYWENPTSLVFSPDQPLDPGKSYVATLYLSKLFPAAPRSIRQVRFSFRTRDIKMDVQPVGLQTPDPQNLSKQNWSGILYTTDQVDDDKLEQCLQAMQNGQKLPVKWEHESGNVHRFVVLNIRRGEQRERVLISWNGAPVQSKDKGDLEVKVPPIGEFFLTNAQVQNEPQQHFILEFSDPLLPSQDLNGLISLKNYRATHIGASPKSFNTTIESNLLYIYPTSAIVGSVEIQVEAGLQNSAGKKLKKAEKIRLETTPLKPQIRISGPGNIVPDSRGLILPFEVTGLKAVELELLEIYHDNILQFLQTNSLNGSNELHRVGKIIARQKIDLQAQKGKLLQNGWTRYAIKLDDLIPEDSKSIYQVRLGFFPGYTTIDCDFDNDKYISYLEPTEKERKDEQGHFLSFMDNWYGIYGYYSGYWNKQEDPCEAAYYNPDHFVSRNLLASNIGLMAKKGDNGSIFCVSTDLRTALPLSGVELSLYNYQQQLLAKAQTNTEGFASFEDPAINQDAFFLVASYDQQNSYLRLTDNNSLSLSRFNTSGTKQQEGLKGYFYAERDVWRPGDSIYLHFVMQNAEKLPKQLPITFELYDARGQMREKRTTSENLKGIYPLHCKTDTDAPTGQWTAKVIAGNARFRKTLLVETIKPNRLKVSLDFGEKELTRKHEPYEGKITARWLHGAPAKDLRAVIEMQIVGSKTSFKDFPAFVFNDPLQNIPDFTPTTTLFDSYLDENGQASFSRQLIGNNGYPGMLRLRFKTRVFEQGGNFSSNTQSFNYSPYASYAGLLIPLNAYREKRLDIGKEKELSFAAVDEKGKALKNHPLKVEIYRVQWRWWWDAGQESLAQYINDSEVSPVLATTLTTNDKGLAVWNVKIDHWGRYLVRVCDKVSGHCAGDFFYAGYPWFSEDGLADANGSSMLSISTSKDRFQTGEEIEINIPAANNSRLLLSLENGNGVLQARWYELQAGNNTIRFKATAEMSPTIYAFATLIQPHAQTENDRPIRMYGVVPIQVEEPSSRLHPQIQTAEEYRPNSAIKITVSEADGRPMAYTLAVVDEGLLDLTNFKTPDPWDGFYAKEGLGVKTFDLYDYVLGAYSNKISRLLSVGGDGDLPPRPEGDKKANRFKPVVLHLGPFQLQKGQKTTHTLRLPNYLGSVRVMLVAASADEKAYGHAEKTVPVRQELMVLASLPRVLGPGEELFLPVNVFAMNDKLRSVNVSLKTDGKLIKIKGEPQQKVSFSAPDEKMVYFPIQVGEGIGVGKVLVLASGHGFESEQEIEIQVRNPNPYLSQSWEHSLNGKDQWTQNYSPIGIAGTNEIVLEASTLPPINLQQHLNYLIHYPYGCLEQTLSGGFPQLHLPDILALSEEQKAEISKNIRATIQRLQNFQKSNGSFAYWPDGSYDNPWSDLYAGHFLLEAQDKGYHVPFGMLNRWLKRQKTLARNWDPKQNQLGYYRYQSDLEQAYRLYLLALAQKAEMGAMNRLRKLPGLSANGRWRLAAAYARIGKQQAAEALIHELQTEVSPYRELSGTFGSSLRDEALILETLTLLDHRDQATKLLKRMAEKLNSNSWWSTQSLAFALTAISKFAGQNLTDNRLHFTYTISGESEKSISSDKAASLIRLPAKAANITVKNLGENLLFVRITATGQPATGGEQAQASNLQLHVEYTDLEGKPIAAQKLTQGTDFLAKVTLRHPGALAPFSQYRELALEQIFPSGWEIANSRLDQLDYGRESPFTYRDIRDDRITTFFNLDNGQQATYLVRLTAAYKGKFYLPATRCSAMYDNSITANNQGQWVVVE